MKDSEEVWAHYIDDAGGEVAEFVEGFLAEGDRGLAAHDLLALDVGRVGGAAWGAVLHQVTPVQQAHLVQRWMNNK